MHYLGEFAALGTAACWAGTALSFAAAGRRVGSLSVNVIKLPIAFGLLAVVGVARGVGPVPMFPDAMAWFWLAVSGLLGFTFGDLCLFRAFIEIGPRISSLVMSAAPVFAALLGWLILGEVLGPVQWLGMMMVVVGIACAVRDRSPSTGRHGPPTIRGVALALGGAVGQGGGLVAAKVGMGDYDPLALTQIRLLAGFVGLALIVFIMRRWSDATRALRQRRAMCFVGLGSLFGPFLGVSLSLVSVQLIETGVAAALMSITPILLIPLVVVLYRERVGIGGVVGAVLAVAGVAVLFLA